MTLNVRVIAPDKTVWDDQAEEVILPSTTGQLGVLSGHAPLLTALDVGVMRVRDKKDWLNIALMGGFAEVEENTVTILVNGAERGDAIDEEKARSEFEEAKEQLNKMSGDDRARKIQAEQALKRSRVRFQAAGGLVKA
ncbi:ATP synthase F1 subunit epsilon [Spirulina sp. CS-785/01]|uniref:ATP synthase F1 subunit epsilon n=1 Tax=Spirulina sp. CS-785/01 TaxID=3021716 RepID=UPI00232F7715|nr:ATP synthase F1 subunit epsilon [Spirulina sp. CS-785/01]MDB9314787.1 ATP synthase F1 subunit epsilon [Spirulina sp. CS-785/01]